MSEAFWSHIKPLDFVVIALALALSVSLIFASGSGEDSAKKLVLYSDDQSVDLSWRDSVIDLQELVNKDMTIEVRDGAARVLDSDCPDKLCEHVGWLSACGEIAICLPNRVALMVDCIDGSRESYHVNEP